MAPASNTPDGHPGEGPLGAARVDLAADPTAVAGFTHGVGGAAAPEGVEDEVAGLGGGLDHAFQVHEEASVAVPHGGVLLASSDLFEVQAYRFRHAYGLQFHLDARQHDIPSWWDDNVARYAGRRGAQPLDEQIADADRYEAAIDRFARRFLTTALAPVITHDTEEITS